MCSRYLLDPQPLELGGAARCAGRGRRSKRDDDGRICALIMWSAPASWSMLWGKRVRHTTAEDATARMRRCFGRDLRLWEGECAGAVLRGQRELTSQGVLDRRICALDMGSAPVRRRQCYAAYLAVEQGSRVQRPQRRCTAPATTMRRISVDMGG